MYKPPDELVSRILSGRIKSVPQVLLRLLNLCNDPNADFDELAGLIEKDAAMSARVLRLAATPSYRQWHQVRDLRRLIAVIGFNSLRTLVVTSGIAQLFRQMAGDEARRIAGIWRISLHCAYSARELAQLTAYPAPAEAYLAGLLHRIGQLALLDVFPADYPEMLDTGKTAVELGSMEKDQFGADHAVLGGWLLDHWQLDPLLADAVRYQFESRESVAHAHPLIRVIHLASRISDPLAARQAEVADLADAWFGLADPVWQELGDRAAEQVDIDARLLGLDAVAEASAATRAVSDENELATQVLRTGLLGAVRSELGELDDLDMTLMAARRQLDLLFETRQCVFFLRDGELLRGRPQADQDPEIAQLSMPVDAEAGLLGAAASRLIPIDSLDDQQFGELTVLDRQLLQRLGGEALLALPLHVDQRLFGIALLAMPAYHQSSLARQHELLALYAAQLAQVMAVQLRKREGRERERLEDRARYEQQARKVVHEANNPLSIVSNYLHVLGARLEENHASKEHLQVIREEIERVGKILLRLPHSYAEDEADAGWIDLQAVLEQLLSVFQATLFKDKAIKSSLQVPAGLPQLRVDRDRFKQVILNLLKNAGEAVERGGRIQLLVRDGINLGGRHCVEVAVVDDGPGVPTEEIEQLFRPQASRKGAGHAGLGLTIAANLVREWGGEISYRALHPGAGFHVLLPRVARATPVAADAS